MHFLRGNRNLVSFFIDLVWILCISYLLQDFVKKSNDKFVRNCDCLSYIIVSFSIRTVCDSQNDIIYIFYFTKIRNFQL